jgi:hypothetical protein
VHHLHKSKKFGNHIMNTMEQLDSSQPQRQSVPAARPMGPKKGDPAVFSSLMRALAARFFHLFEVSHRFPALKPGSYCYRRNGRS